MAGADFIKTSTGKESVNATLPVSLALDPQYAEVTGEYFANHKPALRSPRARNAKLAQELYYNTMAELDLPTL